MSFFKNLYGKLRKTVKFSVSDPRSFEETWSFTSTRIRVISLVTLVFIVFGVAAVYLFGGIFHRVNGGGDVSIEREKLETQRAKIEELVKESENRDKQSAALRMILNGEVPVTSNLDSIINSEGFELEPIDSKPTESEEQLAKKVRDDMRTPKSGSAGIPYFTNPVSGVVSEKFNANNHPGLDIVTSKDETVKSCLSGTVIYAGYTSKDGYVLILDHANGYISVYKHNKTVFKKMGEKVQLGDPIAVVGNTGENTSGPHLHFELWFDQTPIDPEEYLTFKR